MALYGSSGAEVEFSGEWVRKTCFDAYEQNKWFDIARNQPTIEGFRIPSTRLLSEKSYELEFVNGVSGTHSSSTLIILVLIDQILLWSKCASHRHSSWSEYLDRLYAQHVRHSNSCTVMEVFDFIEQEDITIPSTFSHGDLTLENVLIDPNYELVVIDPNFKPNLFQSYILDFGKLLQSTHSNYHHLFDSDPGVDLTPHNELLVGRLRQLGLLKEALISEITHILRIRKYRPQNQKPLVDELLCNLVKEYKSV